MKISTIKLQEMVSKVSAGMGNNKFISITQFLQIEVINNNLILTSTDATNYMYVKDNVESDNFVVVVDGNLFAQLISKMTCEDIYLEITDNCLIIKGNGEYKLDIQLDEEGNHLQFPDVMDKYLPLNNENKQSIRKETITKIVNTNKAALATTLDLPCYTGYYFGDDVISTDTVKICALDANIFKNPMLISADVLELVKNISEETIDVYDLDDNIVIWETDTTRIFSRQLNGIDDYQVDAIMNLVNTDMDNSCEINKSQFLNTLDRLSLFVSQYDRNNINLKFQSNGILCTNKQSNGSEFIPYIDKTEHKEFSCLIDIVVLSSQIKAIPNDVFEIFYGEPNAIKIVCDDITQIIALNAE